MIMDSGKDITFLVDGEICQCIDHVLKWRDLDVFVKHGLTVQPGITITPILVYQCLDVTVSLFKHYFGLNPRSLQDLCAGTIQFSTLNKALLPHQLQKFCQDYLYDELNFWFIKWDAAMHLLSHMYHQLG